MTFSGALAWPYLYPWPQRPAGLIETAFDELAKRWKPILDAFDEQGVDVCYEIHPGEDLIDGVTFEMFLERVGNHPRCCINYDPSHFVLQQLDYLGFIDVYHERIKAFHVKDAEFNPSPRQGVYSGFQPWLDRAGRFRSLGDGQVDFGGIFSKLAGYDYDGWAVLEWECCLKHPEQGAREGAPFIAAHIIQVTETAFDDFAAAAPTRPPTAACSASAEGGRHDDRRQGRRHAGRRLRLGMVGGGQGAFIGAVHRIAARLDDRYELVAGALSADPERARRRPRSSASRRSAPMAASPRWRSKEAARDDGIDVVAIVTPNHVHHPAAKAFLEAGIHVICDKPMTTTVDEALDLVRTVRRTGLVFALTHNYTGYPMVREARELVAGGRARRDPRGAGRVPAGLADHAARGDRPEAGGVADRPGAVAAAARSATSAPMPSTSRRSSPASRRSQLCADLTTFVAGRRVDDNCNILLRYAGGARGMLWACQVAPGNENGAPAAGLRRQGRARVAPGAARPPATCSRSASRRS